jgi:FAD synthase
MLTFSARAVHGAGRGAKEVGYPTINLDIRDVPDELKEGIYACYARLDGEATEYAAVAHYGPSPVFNAGISFEVHLLSHTPALSPQRVQVSLLEERIRPIRDFPTVKDLTEAIGQDIEAAHAMLSARADDSQATPRQ